MRTAVLIDYGCHSFTYRLAARLSEQGFPIRYFVNGSLESPNLSSIGEWMRECPSLVRNIVCRKPYGKMSLVQRLRGEFAWANQCIAALEDEQPGAIIASCIPLVAVTRIQNWANRRRIPFLYWLQDIQGRAIHDLLARKFGFLGRVIGGIADTSEQQILDRSRMVITIAPGHERELPYTVLREGRYALLENWANIEEFPILPPDNDWACTHGLDKTLNIVYSGTLGLKHDLPVFSMLAVALRERSEVRIVVVSSGQAAQTVAEEAARKNLDNLLVLPFQPHRDVPKVLASAAVLIAPLESSAAGFCVPSKILSYLCAGRPTVIAIDAKNAAAKTITRAGAGSVVPPCDPEAFLAAVTALLDNPAWRRTAGQNARAYAERTFALDSVVPKFLEILARSNVSLRPISVVPSQVLATGTV